MMIEQTSKSLARRMVLEGLRDAARAVKRNLPRMAGAAVILVIAGAVETAATGSPAMTMAYGRKLVTF